MKTEIYELNKLTTASRPFGDARVQADIERNGVERVIRERGLVEAGFALAAMAVAGRIELDG
jgi:hypothetical protein